jgi:hypothetical protein
LWLVVGACDLVTGGANPNFKGAYTYLGTINEQPAVNLEGTFMVHDQGSYDGTGESR